MLPSSSAPDPFEAFALAPVSRRAPIRKAILSFVTVPRSASEIARYINRPIPTTTGHLRASCNLGLTKRIARSFYVVSDYFGDAPASRQKVPRSHSEIELRRTLLRLLQTPVTEEALASLAGAHPFEVKLELNHFWINGWLVGCPVHGLQLRDHVKRRLAVTVRNYPE